MQIQVQQCKELAMTGLYGTPRGMAWTSIQRDENRPQLEETIESLHNQDVSMRAVSESHWLPGSTPRSTGSLLLLWARLLLSVIPS